MLSTAHRGDHHVTVSRHGKDAAGHHVQLELNQPKVVSDYNRAMGGVDTFDQMAETYRTLRRTRKTWKSMLYDMVDIAAVISYRMFGIWLTAHQGNTTRLACNPHNSFQEYLIRQLPGIAVHEPPPKRSFREAPEDPPASQPTAVLMHTVKHDVQKKGCPVCPRGKRAPGCHVLQSLPSVSARRRARLFRSLSCAKVPIVLVDNAQSVLLEKTHCLVVAVHGSLWVCSAV